MSFLNLVRETKSKLNILNYKEKASVEITARRLEICEGCEQFYRGKQNIMRCKARCACTNLELTVCVKYQKCPKEKW